MQGWAASLHIMYGYTFRCRTLLGKQLLSFIPKLKEVNNPESNPTHLLMQKLFQDSLGLPCELSNRLAGLWRFWLLAILDSPGCNPSQAPGDHSGKVSSALLLVAFAKHCPVSAHLGSKALPLALIPFQNYWIQSVKTCEWTHILSCHVFKSVSYHIFQRKCRLLTHSQGTPYCRTSIFRLPFRDY